MVNFFKKKHKKDIPDLVFKSNQHAFKYAMEFFKDVPLTKEEAVHGLVTKVIGENYFAKAFCHENNKTVTFEILLYHSPQMVFLGNLTLLLVVWVQNKGGKRENPRISSRLDQNKGGSTRDTIDLINSTAGRHQN